MKIGHNKPPHQLGTVAIEGIPVTLYKRSDLQNPLWQMRIKVPGSTKYVRQSTKCAKFEDAKEVALERYFEIKLQIKNNIPVFNKTFGDLCKEVLKDFDTKLARGEIVLSTHKVNVGRLNTYFVPYFGNKNIASFTQNSIDTFWQWRIDAKKAKAETLYHEAGLLNAVFEKALRQGLIQKKLDYKPPVKRAKDRRSELSREEYVKLRRYALKWITKTKSPRVLYARARLYYLIKIAVNSGMRPSEFYNLIWADYTKQTENGFEWTELRVQGKGKRHTIQCSIRVFHDLEHWKMDSFYAEPNDYVFADKNGKRPQSYNLMFKKLLVEAGIPLEYQGEPRTINSLRHTYATFQLRSGIDRHFLAENMDTGLKMITEHYGHVKGADRARAVVLGHKRFS